jgi:hypothetical protein
MMDEFVIELDIKISNLDDGYKITLWKIDSWV